MVALLDTREFSCLRYCARIAAFAGLRSHKHSPHRRSWVRLPSPNLGIEPPPVAEEKCLNISSMLLLAWAIGSAS